jgi:hypothetical protein
MNHTIDPVPGNAPAAFLRLPTARSDHEVFGDLPAALGPMWSVHREIDYAGEVSIIVLPDDGYVGPAFLLYEKDGLVRVGTVSGDEWTRDEGFSGVQAAISAIIAKAISFASGRPAGSMPPDRRHQRRFTEIKSRGALSHLGAASAPAGFGG